MTKTRPSSGVLRIIAWAVTAATSVSALPPPSHAVDDNLGLVTRSKGWLVRPFAALQLPAPPKSLQDERAALAKIVAERTAEDIARYGARSRGNGHCASLCPLRAGRHCDGSSRVWAGIHFRFDIDAGQEIGRNVALKTLARAFVAKHN